MAYIKYKELTKYFYFSKVLDKSSIPYYLLDYVYEDEQFLTVYKTKSDHGIFTDKKIILFDLASTFGIAKKIYIIPYKSISTASILFKSNSSELVLMLDSGYPVIIKFVNMSGLDKVRLRYIYTIMTQAINNQKLNENMIKDLIEDNIKFKNKK